MVHYLVPALRPAVATTRPTNIRNSNLELAPSGDVFVYSCAIIIIQSCPPAPQSRIPATSVTPYRFPRFLSRSLLKPKARKKKKNAAAAFARYATRGAYPRVIYSAPHSWKRRYCARKANRIDATGKCSSRLVEVSRLTWCMQRLHGVSRIQGVRYGCPPPLTSGRQIAGNRFEVGSDERGIRDMQTLSHINFRNALKNGTVGTVARYCRIHENAAEHHAVVLSSVYVPVS